MATKLTLQEQREKRIADQLAWIEKCGGTLAGYIRNYGDPGINTAEGKPMFGDGGTLIFKADTDRLSSLINDCRYINHPAITARLRNFAHKNRDTVEGWPTV